MPHMHLEVTSDRYTSRDGTHEDDLMYIEQVKDVIKEKLEELSFVRTNIKLEFTP